MALLSHILQLDLLSRVSDVGRFTLNNLASKNFLTFRRQITCTVLKFRELLFETFWNANCQKFLKNIYINNVGLADTQLFLSTFWFSTKIWKLQFCWNELSSLMGNIVKQHLYAYPLFCDPSCEQTLYPILAEEDKRIKIDSLDRIDTHFFLRFWPLITHIFDDFILIM